MDLGVPGVMLVSGYGGSVQISQYQNVENLTMTHGGPDYNMAHHQLSQHVLRAINLFKSLCNRIWEDSTHGF